MASSAKLQVAKNLIALERGADELLLANSFHLRPLYVKRGRERVKQILAAVAQGCTTAELQAVFPSDAALLRLLLDYHLLPESFLPEDDSSRIVCLTDAVRSRSKNSITLYLLLGEFCNLACIYCLNGPKTYRRDNHTSMNAAVARRSVERCLEELSPGGTVAVAFFGGEPLLHWPLVKKVIRSCEGELKPAHPDKRIEYHLTTNLTLSPADLVEWVSRHDISIVCGIDGPPEIHDRCRPYPGGVPSHARSAETIRRLAEAGARVTLRATITSANHDSLLEVAAHHTRLGAVSSLFIPVRPINSDQDFFPEEILPDPDKVIAAALELGRPGRPGKANLFPFNDFSAEIHPGVRHAVACAAPYGTNYVVRASGDVYPCIYLVGQEPYRLGNVAGALDRRPLDGMLKALHVDNREDCRECAWRYACGGGCPVMNLARIRGAEKRPGVVRYSRRITCDLSQAILAEALWGLADQTQVGPPQDRGQESRG
ncbi:MAG: radical SAM protein [Deltaproteobacteria bacterium]|nr:radical SAM protein [Deltaproteobacteria bacterium]